MKSLILISVCSSNICQCNCTKYDINRSLSICNNNCTLYNNICCDKLYNITKLSDYDELYNQSCYNITTLPYDFTTKNIASTLSKELSLSFILFIILKKMNK